MQPKELAASSFPAYPMEARELPLVLVVVLLREMMGYDWKFSAERAELEKQIEWLRGLSGAERANAVEGFVLPLGPALTGLDWVGNPAGFMESFTAWLWSTHRLDEFRATAEAYAGKVNAAFAEVQPAMPQLGIVVVGAGTRGAEMPLFRKLRPHGANLMGVAAEGGL